MEGRAVILLEDVSFSYAKRSPALQGVTLRIPAGSVTAVLGHNGAGKTTLLKLAAGLFAPDSGTVSFGKAGGKPRIAFIPDHGGAYAALSARANLVFRAKLANAEDPARAAQEALELVDLADRADEPAHTLSHGMRKRLALACAYVSKPQVYLLDEALNGIDPESLAIACRFLREEAASRGAAVAIATHDLPLASALCSHLIVLDRRSCAFSGAIDELERPLDEAYFALTGRGGR